MRSIGHLPNESQARLFGDYLLAQGIRNNVEPDSDGSWLIWVTDDDHLDAGRTKLEQFCLKPDAPEFSRVAAKAEELRSTEEKSQQEWRRRLHNRRRIFPGSKHIGPGPLTYVLISACVVVAWMSGLDGNSKIFHPLFISLQFGGEAGFLSEVRRGEVWRLFTPMLIHFNLPHIVFNMMWLFQLGSMIESVQGPGWFVLLVLVFALGSNLAQYAFAHPSFGGMSGVNYALIGYVWIRGKFDPASGLHLDKQAVGMSIAFFFLCFTGWMGNIANYAHGGGLLLGMAWGWLSAKIALRSP